MKPGDVGQWYAQVDDTWLMGCRWRFKAVFISRLGEERVSGDGPDGFVRRKVAGGRLALRTSCVPLRFYQEASIVVLSHGT